MVRLLLLLGSLLTVRSPRQPAQAWYPADGPHPAGGYPASVPAPGAQAHGVLTEPGAPPPAGPPPAPRRRRIRPRAACLAAVVAAGLIFRKAVAALVLMALSAALHVVGVNVHLPRIKLAWPWQTITAGTTTNTDLGPWVLQRIEGISRPALGRANFTFYFTHKVSKNIGPWPCW